MAGAFPTLAIGQFRATLPITSRQLLVLRLFEIKRQPWPVGCRVRPIFPQSLSCTAGSRSDRGHLRFVAARGDTRDGRARALFIGRADLFFSSGVSFLPAAEEEEAVQSRLLTTLSARFHQFVRDAVASYGDNGHDQDTPRGSGEPHRRRFARPRQGEHRCRWHAGTSAAPVETCRPRCSAQQLPAKRNREACT